VRMTLRSRRELTRNTAERYRSSSKGDKGKILTEFCAGTGYNRTYAGGLLKGYGKHKAVRKRNTACPSKNGGGERPKGGRPATYGAEDVRVLKILWKRFDFLCGKRLVPLLRAILPRLDGEPFLRLSEEIRRKLSTISAATVDRLLGAERKRYRLTGTSYTRSGESLKNLIPVRTFDEWNGCPPGHAQIDTVGHDGGGLSGECSFTLCLTDVCTGWTERYAMQNRAFKWVHQGLDVFRETIPFPILHLHPDSGSEFINHGLVAYCAESEHPITLTRSRAGKRNDNCYVEQKNFDTIRKLVGYARYSTPEMLDALNQLYRAHGLLINYFYPSQKLIQKTRRGSKVIKRYDRPVSPVERLLAHLEVSDHVKRKALAVRASLNPFHLAHEVDTCSDNLRRLLLEKGSSMAKAEDAP
jgi:hypothetical protein